MKAVLISIRPKWVEKIVSGEKTLEVRKTRPKLETPFKCYIYCTGVKRSPLGEYVEVHRKTGGAPWMSGRKRSWVSLPATAFTGSHLSTMHQMMWSSRHA